MTYTLVRASKTTVDIDKEEADMQFYLENGQQIAADLIQFADETITKMCAAKLYISLLGLHDDYYNVYYGRHRKAWEKDLKNHILIIRKTVKIMLSFGIISKNQVSSFVFEDEPLDDKSVTFPRVEALVFGLLHELKVFVSVDTVFREVPV